MITTIISQSIHNQVQLWTAVKYSFKKAEISSALTFLINVTEWILEVTIFYC